MTNDNYLEIINKKIDKTRQDIALFEKLYRNSNTYTTGNSFYHHPEIEKLYGYLHAMEWCKSLYEKGMKK